MLKKPTLLRGLLALAAFFFVCNWAYSAVIALSGDSGISVEDVSIEERYPQYRMMELVRNEFENPPEEWGSSLVEAGLVEFSSFDSSQVLKYGWPYELRLGRLGIPVRFFGENFISREDGVFYLPKPFPELSSGAFVVLMAPYKDESLVIVSQDGTPLWTFLLWEGPVDDANTLYIYRVESSTRDSIPGVSFETSVSGTILWSVTLSGQRTLLDGEFSLQNILPDSTISPSLDLIYSSNALDLLLGQRVEVEGVPFILTSYHFSSGHLFVPKMFSSMFLLMTWYPEKVPTFSSEDGSTVPGQSVLWSSLLPDSDLVIGVVEVPFSQGKYFVDQFVDVLGITTR